MTESTDLIISQPLNASVVFAPGGVEKVLAEIEAKARAFKGDISTKTGRDEVKSFAYKITRSKTALDELGKDFVADIKKRAGEIDAERRTIREKLDELKDEVRKPLTEYEARIASREADIVRVIQFSDLSGTDGSSQECERRLMDLADWDWPLQEDEFTARFHEARCATKNKLLHLLGLAKEREAAAAELEQLRHEKAERDAAAAVEAERKRVADEQAAADAERKRREDDKAHRKTINTAILAALIKAGLSTEDGMRVIVAIVKREVPHTIIEY